MIARFKNKICIDLHILSATLLTFLVCSSIGFGVTVGVAFVFLHDLPKLIARFELQTLVQQHEKDEINRQAMDILANVTTAVDSERNVEMGKRKAKGKKDEKVSGL